MALFTSSLPKPLPPCLPISFTQKKTWVTRSLRKSIVRLLDCHLTASDTVRGGFSQEAKYTSVFCSSEHTTDLGFPRSALLSSSCQYTMVPLGGLPGHQANGQPYLSGINGRACASRLHGSRGCPVAAAGCPGRKPQQRCPGELAQVMGS